MVPRSRDHTDKINISYSPLPMSILCYSIKEKKLQTHTVVTCFLAVDLLELVKHCTSTQDESMVVSTFFRICHSSGGSGGHERSTGCLLFQDVHCMSQSNYGFHEKKAAIVNKCM